MRHCSYPTLAKTKAKAQRIACISNLKQIGLGINLYAPDNDGSLPGPLLTGIQAGYNLSTGGDSPFPRLGNFLWSELAQPNPDYEILQCQPPPRA